MKFELKPYNWGLSDDVLLDDLRGVAQKIGKQSVTKEQYNQHGRLCASALQKRFGSWCRAHELAGLRKIRHYDATADDCIADLKSVAAKLGRATLAFSDYKPYGKYSIALIARRCGSYTAALGRAGLLPSPRFHEALSDEQLFENLEHLWVKLGRQPSKGDFGRPVSRYSYGPYPRRFGSYRKALEAFVAYVGKEEPSPPAKPDMASTGKADCCAVQLRHKTKRQITERLKVRVLIRDGNRCKLCGVVVTGADIHFDHVKPWSEGGETVIENIQVLCAKHNLAKGDYYEAQ